MSWLKIRVADYGKIITGNTPPKKNPEYYGGAYKFIKPTDMEIGSRFTPITDEYYSQEAYEKYKRSLIPPFSTCVVTIGTIGKKMTLTDDYCFVNQAVNVIVPNTEKYDPYFVFYSLKNMLHRVKAADTGASSGRENVSKNNFSNLTLEIPSTKNVQEKISSILSALDDLMENNLKRIKIMEEAIQNIFNEWFIRFQFPNCQNTRIENGLPKGWKKEMLENHIDLERGIEVGSGNYLTENSLDTLPFIRVGDLNKRSNDVFVNTELVKNKVVTEKDILLSLDGSVGIVRYGIYGAYSTGIRKAFIKNELLSNAFVFCLLSSVNIQNTIKAHATGATILHAGSSTRYMEFTMPDERTIKLFNDIAVPILNQCINLTKQNGNLKDALDILLPRLMNRTIEV